LNTGQAQFSEIIAAANMIKANNPGRGILQLYKDLLLVIREPKMKASSKVETLKGLEYNYGLILDDKTQKLMK